MAFLAPLAATGAGAAGTAAALGTGAAAAGASTALGAGLSAGTILGTGAASSGILGGLGLNALGGMTSILPASAGLTAAAAPGLAALAPTAGIFAKAAPALGGLQSLAAPGIFAKATPALGGLSSLTPMAAQAASPLAAAGSTAALETAKAGIIQNAMTQNAMQNAIMQNVAGGQAAQNLAGAAGSQFTNVAPNLVGRNDILQAFQQAQANPFRGTELAKTADASNYLTEGIGREFPSIETRQLADLSTRTQTGGLRAPTGTETGGIRLTPSVAERAMIPRGSPIVSGENFMSNLGNLIQNPSVDAAVDYAKEHPYATAAGAYGLYNLMQPKYKAPEVDKGTIRPYEYNITQRPEAYAAAPGDSSEQRYFNTEFIELPTYTAKEGGLMSLAVGGPVEQMAELNTVGANTGYPMAHINSPFYANPTMQRPEAVNTLFPSSDAAVGTYTGEAKFAGGGPAVQQGEGDFRLFGKILPHEKLSGYEYSYNPQTMQFSQTGGPGAGAVTGGIAGGAPAQSAAPAYSAPPAIPYQSPAQQLGLTDFYAMMDERLKQQAGGYAGGGGISSLQSRFNLGDYSDGGRLLKGPGDGVSDSIPASIGNRRPARLADGEFVVPARIVSELGNGSTEAGARKLYAMMDRVQKARRKTVGKKKVAVNSRADKHLPA
jgi:hypothetical protein